MSMSAASSLPDYYQLLGVSPQADAEAIRKAYRNLARKYHPDAAPDNPFAPAQFRALKEAYEILSVPQNRRRYDEERWLRGIRKTGTRVLNASGLLEDSEKLLRHLQQIGKSSVQPGGLQNLLLYLLQDKHLAILSAEGNAESNDRFMQSLFQSAGFLPWRLQPPVLRRLQQIAPVSAAKSKELNQAIATNQRRYKQEQRLPWLVLLLTLFLCLLIAMGIRYRG